MQIRADQFVKLRRGAGDPAGDLLAVDSIGEEGERLGPFIARLSFGLGIVDRAAVDPRRRAGLKAAQLEAEARESQAQAGAGRFAHTSAGHRGIANVQQPLHKSAGAEDDGPGAICRAA